MSMPLVNNRKNIQWRFVIHRWSIKRCKPVTQRSESWAFDDRIPFNVVSYASYWNSKKEEKKESIFQEENNQKLYYVLTTKTKQQKALLFAFLLVDAKVSKSS